MNGNRLRQFCSKAENDNPTYWCQGVKLANRVNFSNFPFSSRSPEIQGVPFFGHTSKKIWLPPKICLWCPKSAKQTFFFGKKICLALFEHQRRTLGGSQIFLETSDLKCYLVMSGDNGEMSNEWSNVLSEISTYHSEIKKGPLFRRPLSEYLPFSWSKGREM